MTGLLTRSTLRQLRRQRWQTWLSVLGIALGVAVIVAVDLANQSARQAFLLSAESIAGRATHRIVGGTAGLEEDLYRRLRVEQGLRRSAPIVEGLLRHGGEALQLLGVDPLAEAPFRSLAGGLDTGITRRLMLEPGTALLARTSAERLGIAPGADLDIQVAGHATRLHIIGLLEGDHPAALEGLVVTDISTAQELLRRSGRLDRIDLILERGDAERLSRILPPGARLEVPESRTRVLLEMIQAFQTNLTAMSLLALLVGAFLIYNTMTFAVLRRRVPLATLRLLGVTRARLFRLLLLEALLLGVAGTALGLLLGIATAHYLVQLVTRTINDLYFLLTVTQLLVEPQALVKAAAVGIGVTLLASLVPALDAAGTAPVQALRRSRLERGVRRGLPWLFAAGVIALAVGGWLVRSPAAGLAGGFTGLFLIIGGYSLLVPPAVSWLARAGRMLAGRRRLLTRFALRGIDAELSRTGLAVAALAVAVAAALGVGIMITSFRATVADWLDYTLRSDLYVAAVGEARDADGALPPSTRARIAALPQVRETSLGRRLEVRTDRGPVEMLALDPATGSEAGFRFLSPPVDQLWSRYRRGELVLISEPFAVHHGLRRGDALRLDTPTGPRVLPVGGVFYDYGSDRGLISLAHGTYARWWNDDRYSTVGVFLRAGVTGTAAAEAIHAALAPLDRPVRITSSRDIREQSLAVFDRTFTITRVLRLLAIAVAFTGVLSALLALQLERSREQAILRATGVTPSQMARLTLLQTGLMGLYAGLLALPLGWLMSRVLIEVINYRSFGWSIEAILPAGALAEALVLAVAAALLSGLYPAWRMARSRPALALREE